MKRDVMSRMKAEVNLWRLAAGLLGGWSMLAMGSAAMAYGWGALAYVATHSVRSYLAAETVAATAGTFASACFAGAILGIIIGRRQMHQHALLRLSPNVRPLIAAMNMRLVLAAVLSLPPAIVLRALVALEHRSGSPAAISLIDVSSKGYLTVLLTLIFLAAMIVVTFGWLRAPTRFAFLPIYWGATQWTSLTWSWLPLAACVVIVIGHRIWLRTDMAAVVRVSPTERRQQLGLIERLRSRRLQRAARVAGGRGPSQRVTALLSTQRSALFTLLTVFVTMMYITIAPGVFDVFTGGWFFAYLVVALLATPTPVPLGQVMLLPLGAERRSVGHILMSVWARDVRFRLLLGVALGLLLRAIVWWLELLSFMRPPFIVPGDQFMLLLGRPLMHAVGLYGAAYALCWTISASPRLLAKPGVLATLPMFVVVAFCALGGALGWTLAAVFPELGSGAMSSLRFTLVNAVMLPAIAWWVNRQLRPQWLSANLGAIATAMQAWLARRQKASTPW